MFDDLTNMSNKQELDRKLLVEFTKASQEARGKLAKFNCEIFDDMFSCSELYLGRTLQESFEIPSSISFLRNHVSKNLPLVIRGALKETAAVKKWNSQHFR